MTLGDLGWPWMTLTLTPNIFWVKTFFGWKIFFGLWKFFKIFLGHRENFGAEMFLGRNKKHLKFFENFENFWGWGAPRPPPRCSDYPGSLKDQLAVVRALIFHKTAEIYSFDWFGAIRSYTDFFPKTDKLGSAVFASFFLFCWCVVEQRQPIAVEPISREA